MLATRAVLLFFLMVGLGVGFKTPAASASFQVASISKLLKVWLPHFLQYIVTPQTILKEEITVSNWLGTLRIQRLHLDQNIDFTDVLISGLWENESKLQLALVSVTIQVDFDYEVDTITTLYGYGNVRAIKVGLMTGISLQKLSDNQWTVVLTQDKMTINQFDLTLSSSILSALAQLGKDSLENYVLTALRDEVYPKWNEIIKTFASSTDPTNGAITLDDSGYFISADMIGIPKMSQSNDYVQAQFNGLAYETNTLDTHATNDLTYSERDLTLQEQQINLSDNTVESLVPALLKLYAHQVAITDSEQTYKSILQLILTKLPDYFDDSVVYTYIIDYKNNEPDYTIEKDLMTLRHVNLDIDIYAAAPDWSYNDHVVNFSMQLTLALSGHVTDFKAYGDIKVAEIEADTFQMTSYIGDLGRTEAEIEQLFTDLLNLLMDTLTTYIQEYDLTTFIPTRFNYILTNIKDVSLTLGDEADFMRVGFSYDA